MGWRKATRRFEFDVNFLAHTWLAGSDPALRVGGLVGDFVKGPLPGTLPPDLARGVALHRAIDRFADEHPAFRRSRARVSAPRRRWSGVLVDIFYDHLLARDWGAWHPDALRDYAQGVYAEALARSSALPPGCPPVLQRMASDDWLSAYAGVDGLALTLARMGSRARQPNPLAGAEAELLTDMQALRGFEADCRDFLHDAHAFARDWTRAA